MRIWRAFYAFMWIYIFLNNALYWTYFVEFVYNQDTTPDTHLRQLWRGVALMWSPVILTCLSYTLLYY